MKQDIQNYHNQQTEEDKAICNTLYQIIAKELPDAENKIWHGHPVWFLEGNPIVGYDKLKAGIRLMFWSGKDFEEAELISKKDAKFKDAAVIYTHKKDIKEKNVKRWLQKSRAIQWDYKNIIKRKGELVRLK